MWITRYKGVQLFSDVSPDTVQGSVITFVDGSTYDIADGTSTGHTTIIRLQPADPRYTTTDSQSTPARPIVDITELGGGQYMLSSHDGNKILSGNGKFSINLGSPADMRGIQIGHGTTQINRF